METVRPLETWTQKSHIVISAIFCRSKQVTRPVPTQGVEKYTPSLDKRSYKEFVFIFNQPQQEPPYSLFYEGPIKHKVS